MKRVAVVALALLSGACAAPQLKSSLPPQPAPVSEAGRVPVVLKPEAVAAAMKQVQSALMNELASVAPPAVRSSWREAGAGVLVLALDAGGLFEAGSAQLRVEALETCGAIATGLRAQPGMVVHSVAYDEDADVEPSLRLSARRAASVEEELVREGVPAARVRAEGRPGRARVELLIVPVVEGAEARAWLPPS